MLIGFVCIAGVLALLILWGITIYNRLVIYQSYYRNALAQIEVQLKRRYDLIPNLVEVTKRYLQHEHDTLLAVTQARNQAITTLNQLTSSTQPADLSALLPQLAQAEQALQHAMQQLSIQIEAYPDLKADQSMTALTEELTSTENRIAFARQGFNDAVTTYNMYRQQFPYSVIAVRYGHTQDAPLLELDNPELYRSAPQIKL